MKAHARVLGIGVVVLAAACLIGPAGSGNAADEKEDPKAKEIRAALLKLTEAIEKGDAGETKKASEALQKYELLPIMKNMKLRANGGLGVGAQPGAITPDGIEAKVIGMARKNMTKGELEKQGAELAKAAYVIAAIAEITPAKAPVKTKMGDKDPKDWAKWSEDMSKFSRELAKAAQAKDPDKVKAAAANLNSSCNSCHGIFRD